jgi:hypothetical protein
MDSKKVSSKEVQLAIQALYTKIEVLKERVDALCESSDCFKTTEKPKPKKDAS